MISSPPSSLKRVIVATVRHIYYDLVVSTSKFNQKSLQKFFESGVYTNYNAKYKTRFGLIRSRPHQRDDSFCPVMH